MTRYFVMLKARTWIFEAAAHLALWRAGIVVPSDLAADVLEGAARFEAQCG